MQNELKISDSTDIRVKLKLNCFDGDLHAVLNIKDNKWPALKLDSLSTDSFAQIKLTDIEENIIHCQSESFECSLINNTAQGHIVWPKYIVQGRMDSTTSGVEVLISGFSEWFDQRTYFEIRKSEIRKERPIEQIDEIITIDNKRYRIKSNYNCRINNVEKRDFLVSESTTISVVSIDNPISAEQAEILSYEIRRFFALLLAVPLSIERAWLIDKEGKNRKPFYFVSSTARQKPFEFPKECLIRPIVVGQEIGWNNLFSNYVLNRSMFKNIWGRLISLFSYSDIFDYELLGYVSVLDSFCDAYSHKKGDKLRKSDFKDLKKDLNSIIDQYSQKLDSKYKAVIDGLKEGIDGIKNTNLPTFKKKYEYMIKSMEPEILGFIGFTDEDFIAIKKIRDAAAHGLPIKTRNDGDISYEFKLRDKLAVLLLYLVYRDFGIPHIKFAESISNTFNKFVRNAGVKRATLDKLIGTVPFWKVNEESFSAASKSKKFYIGIEYYRSKDTYLFSMPLTQKCHNWLLSREPKEKKLVDYIRASLSDHKIVEVEFISKAYLEYNNETIELSGVCKISHE